MDLEVFISKDTNTLPIMDRFEKREQNKKVYNGMIIRNSERVTIDGFLYKYNLIVERINCFESKPVGNITLSEFKKHKGSVTQRASSYLINYAKEHQIKVNAEIYFDKPFYLRAQSSSNREGYGWEWEWDNLISVGTEYGETNDYGFVGAKIESINPDNNSPINYDSIPDPKRVEVVTYNGSKYFKAYEDDTHSYMFPYKNGLDSKQIAKEYKEMRKRMAERGRK